MYAQVSTKYSSGGENSPPGSPSSPKMLSSERSLDIFDQISHAGERVYVLFEYEW
jgi:hypothetical protein